MNAFLCWIQYDNENLNFKYFWKILKKKMAVLALDACTDSERGSSFLQIYCFTSWLQKMKRQNFKIISKNLWRDYLKNHWNNNIPACTHLNAFFMLNSIQKLPILKISEKKKIDLSCAFDSVWKRLRASCLHVCLLRIIWCHYSELHVMDRYRCKVIIFQFCMFEIWFWNHCK